VSLDPHLGQTSALPSPPLESCTTLAEAGQKPEDNVLQKAAKTSMKILIGTVTSLPDAAKLAEACSKLLPLITKVLGLPF